MLIGMVRVYQILISPFLGKHCRFYPSCSYYALQSLEYYGPIKGVWMTILRLLKCNSFHPGGIDQVPSQKD